MAAAVAGGARLPLDPPQGLRPGGGALGAAGEWARTHSPGPQPQQVTRGTRTRLGCCGEGGTVFKLSSEILIKDFAFKNNLIPAPLV